MHSMRNDNTNNIVHSTKDTQTAQISHGVYTSPDLDDISDLKAEDLEEIDETL